MNKELNKNYEEQQIDPEKWYLYDICCKILYGDFRGLRSKGIKFFYKYEGMVSIHHPYNTRITPDFSGAWDKAGTRLHVRTVYIKDMIEHFDQSRFIDDIEEIQIMMFETAYKKPELPETGRFTSDKPNSQEQSQIIMIGRKE
jgi:hypothetical protein